MTFDYALATLLFHDLNIDDEEDFIVGFGTKLKLKI